MHRRFKICAARVWLSWLGIPFMLSQFLREDAMATKFQISETKLHKIDHDSGPVQRTLKIFPARVGSLYPGISIMLLKCPREVAMATKFWMFEPKLHKNDHNFSHVQYTFNIFVPKVGFSSSTISTMLCKFSRNIWDMRAKIAQNTP